MNWMCQQCGFEFHIDDARVPSHAFSTECPRCRKNVTVTPPAKPEPTLRSDGTPSRTQAIGAPASSRPPAASNPQEMMQMFMQMMAGMAGASGGSPPKITEALQKGFAWQRKQVVVCCAELGQREIIENALDKTRYETTIAQTSAQAIEIMHDLKIEIVLLDPQFDASRQGGIAVLRHISSLMPKYRRRIYVVLVSPQVKTLDTYMAFLNCVNLTVNSDDLESLQAILEKSIKDFNDLYRPMYEAAGLSHF
ncbi:MAG: hypothetical protein AB1489_23080 [Acidobacteriota bacterium]